tara:strand:+ start:78998 stop:79261 length:264 start_codon:yes stop_codon:yes gene_type:complete
MTGGIGFSRQASDSFKQNRALRNKRKSMNSNPYSSQKMGVKRSRGNFDFNEIQNFRSKRKRKSRLISIIVMLVFLMVVSVLMALIMT